MSLSHVSLGSVYKRMLEFPVFTRNHEKEIQKNMRLCVWFFLVANKWEKFFFFRVSVSVRRNNTSQWRCTTISVSFVYENFSNIYRQSHMNNSKMFAKFLSGSIERTRRFWDRESKRKIHTVQRLAKQERERESASTIRQRAATTILIFRARCASSSISSDVSFWLSAGVCWG